MRKNTNLAEEDHENSNVHSTDRVHPKVTTKKTFFDIHQIRRSNINVGISETVGSTHPKIEWSADTTDVGNGFQSKNDGEKTIFDPMAPILLSNQPINSPNTKRPSPLVPNPWGAIDVQSTQPEEIMHLINPSRVVQKPETSRDALSAKSRKSIIDKFRKNAAKVIVARRLERQTRQKKKIENVVPTNPEEEFECLNENYVREGILPKNFQTDFPTEKWSSSKTGGPRVENRRNRLPDLDRGHEIPTRVSAQEKGVKIQGEAKGPETIETPLPARRSCEPHDVKDLRKIRDSDPGPGPSRHMTSKRETGTSQTIDELFPTSNLFILDSENGISTKNTKTDTTEELNATGKNGDRFKIENPFSDFSLQTLSRKKTPFKSDSTEMKTVSHYPDPSQPSTSKQVSSVDAYMPKVSHNEIVENPKRETPKSSFSQSQESRTRKTLFLDKAVTISSSETLNSTIDKGRMNFKEVLPGSDKLDQLDNMWTLSPLIRRILRPNFVWSCILSKFHEFDEGSVAFGNFPEASQTNAVIKIVGNTLNHVSKLSDNFEGFYLINYLETSFPAIIFNAMETSRICGRNIGMDYLQSLENEVLSRIGELLPTPRGRKTNLFLPSNPFSHLSRHDDFVEKITRYVKNVILSGSPYDQSLFSYLNPTSPFPTAAVHRNGDNDSNIWTSHFEPHNHRSVLLKHENTLFINLFEKFLNFHQSYRT